jgi:hypothetical protein
LGVIGKLFPAFLDPFNYQGSVVEGERRGKRGPKPGEGGNNYLKTIPAKVTGAVWRMRDAQKRVEELRISHPDLVRAAEQAFENEDRAAVEPVPATDGGVSKCGKCGETLSEGHKCFG